MRGIPKKHVKTGDDPSQADGEQSDDDQVERQQDEKDTDLVDPNRGNGDHQDQRQQVTQQRGEKNGDRNHLGGKDGFGDEVGLI